MQIGRQKRYNKYAFQTWNIYSQVIKAIELERQKKMYLYKKTSSLILKTEFLKSYHYWWEVS